MSLLGCYSKILVTYAVVTFELEPEVDSYLKIIKQSTRSGREFNYVSISKQFW